MRTVGEKDLPLLHCSPYLEIKNTICKHIYRIFTTKNSEIFTDVQNSTKVLNMPYEPSL
jgi:hypothetical protein